MKKKNVIGLFMALSTLMIVPGLTSAHADETVQQKAQDQADQANAKTKKAERKANQQARNAENKKNVAKDARDQAANTSENVANQAKHDERSIGSG